MKLRHYLTIWTLVALSFTVISAVGYAATPMYFKHGCWLCTSVEYYQEAKSEILNLKGRTFEEVRNQLFETGKCIYIEDGQVTDVVAPYIEVVEKVGSMWKISFIMKTEERITIIHRNLNWYRFEGWTDAANLKELW